jgi:2-aminobenzoate-CoA ligase
MIDANSSAPSAHVDSFTRDNLPPPEALPEFLFALEGLNYPARLNAAVELLDAHVAAGQGDAPCLISPAETWTYGELSQRVNRIANVLTRDLGLRPGNRVLLRSANTPMLVAAYLAIIKAGGVVVATMPMLRAKELAYPLAKARIALGLCDERLREELDKASTQVGELKRIVTWNGAQDGELETLMAKPGYDVFEACDTAADDICLIGFTSGTTGEPKGTMHAHRDLLAVCDTYGRHVLKPTADDRFIGSPPLAFTFGLGGLVLFPLRVGASTVLLENAAPDHLLAAFAAHRPTICFTAPTAYRAMLPKLAGFDISSLRKCVSAGEALPVATFEAWKAATGLPLMDGIGATEMLHIFIAAPEDRIRPGSTGLPVPGFEAKIVDDEGRDVPDGRIGKLAVRGPTGCRYLADARQAKYVQNGWNVTGDTYIRDADGYFWYQARSDDMIVSSGYNIAGPEVEACLLSHPAVAECGVIGVPDAERGRIVKAFVVLQPGHAPDAEMTRTLQDYVKAEIAPYKYPRAIAYLLALPRTQTGKLQRFALRDIEAESAKPAKQMSEAGGLHRRLQPPHWKQPRGYANGIAARGTVCVTGGVIGWDEQEQFPEGGFLPQVRQTLRNIVAILAEAGAGPEHIVRLTWYVTDMDAYRSSLRELGPIYREVMGRNFPAMALVQVVGLVEPQACVEIEATAVVPDG